MGPETAVAGVASLQVAPGVQVQRLRRQVEVMLTYVLDRGLSPAPQTWMFEAVRDGGPGVVDLAGEGWNPAGGDAERRNGTEALVRAHRELSRMVAPARPASLELLYSYSEGRRPVRTPRIPLQKARTGGPGGSSGSLSLTRPVARRPTLPGGSSVPLIRGLVFATLGFLAVFVVFAASPDARAAAAGFRLTDGGAGTGAAAEFGVLLVRELFLIAAAGLGACLTGLFRASKDVARGVYDPEFDHTFVQRVLLGMAAGLIIAEVLPIGTGAGGAPATLARPAVALLGGFAADVVHHVLSRLMAALETLVSGDTELAEAAARELESKRADEIRTQAERAALSRLLEIRRIASSGSPTRAIIDEIDRMIEQVAPL